MILHVFNSSSISGPERLVVPALAGRDAMIINLRETRLAKLQQADPLEAYARSYRLPFRAIPVQGRWDSQAIKKLRDLLLEVRPDLAHAHIAKASIYLQRAAGPRDKRRFPIVSTHHGARGLPDWKTRLYERLYRRWFLKFFDRILAVSQEDFAFLQRSGLSAEQLRLHENGVDARRITAADRPREAQRVRSLWLPQESARDSLFLFGVIARLSAEKDHDRLLQALAVLNTLPSDRDWRCLIFGSGELEARLRQQAREAGLDQRVVWMGYRPDVADELAGLDLLMSFSKAEGMPINLIEAGWAGTPIFGTRVGGIKELIPDERVGSWIEAEESAEAIAKRLQVFLSNVGRDSLRSQGERYHERVMGTFSKAHWMKRLDDIYAELGVRTVPAKESAGSRASVG